MANADAKRPEIRKETNGDLSVVVGPTQFQACVDSQGRCSLVLNDGSTGCAVCQENVVEASIELDGPTLDVVILALQELRGRVK